MKISTRYFGEIEYDPAEILTFPDGIFGFEQQKSFLPIPFDVETDSPLCLQSITTAETAFIIMNPFLLKEDYAPILESEDIQALGSPDESEISFYVISVINEPMENSTVNLKCPIAVNSVTRTARQVILNQEEYKFRHKLSSLSEGGA